MMEYGTYAMNILFRLDAKDRYPLDPANWVRNNLPLLALKFEVHHCMA